jgi:Pyruvate/2-oxoacid:ferredoxin oxidoreductase delta subunit
MMYQCEECGQLMEEPATTEAYPGYDETVVLRFCRGCSQSPSDGSHE